MCATVEQRLDHHPAWRLPHIVGLRLERKAPERERSVPQVGPEAFDHAVDQHVFLSIVDAAHGLEDAQALAVVRGRMHQRLHVFWKAAATIADTSVEEAVADAWVSTNAPAHLLDIDPKL